MKYQPCLFEILLLSVAYLKYSIGHRALPSAITCGPQFATPDTALEIPNPTISWATYRIYDCDNSIAWYEAAGSEDQEFKFTITVPVIERFANVRMTTVIIGEGLPAVPIDENIPQAVTQYISDNGLGGVVFKSPEDQSTCDHLTSPEMKDETSIVDGRCHFYEPFGGSNLWTVMDRIYKLPTTTTYKIAVYEENSSTAKASFACCDWPEDFFTQFDIPDSTCEACGAVGKSWSSLYYEHKGMAAYGGYPPLQNCATNQAPIELPDGDQCPPSDQDSGIIDQPESCVLGCGKDGECHSHNVFGECIHELEWSLSPKFGEADVEKVVIFKGDIIRFAGPSDTLAHNLFELKDETAMTQCNFDDATWVAGVEEINVGHDVVFDEAGTFFFACTITSHCAAGQQLIVEVKDATDGLRCHDHDLAASADSDVIIPIKCQQGTVNARIINDATYGAASENECSEQCVTAVVLPFMPGFELGSCADVGYTFTPMRRSLTVPGSPVKVDVVVASDTATSDPTCHCHSYEEISCAEDDALYDEHIEEIEQYCTGVLDGSTGACPYKCFQPIEVLHLHYLECPDRKKDSTYSAVEALNKCHIAAEAPGGADDCEAKETTDRDDFETDEGDGMVPPIWDIVESDDIYRDWTDASFGNIQYSLNGMAGLAILVLAMSFW